MTSPPQWWQARRCAWYSDHRALVFGGHAGPPGQLVHVPGDRFVQAVLELAESPRVQQLVRAAGGSASRMFAELSPADRDQLAAQVAALRETHRPAPEKETVPCD